MSTEDQVQALELQVAELQSTVAALLAGGEEVKGGVCGCGGRGVDVNADGVAFCDSCSSPLPLEGKALDVAEAGVWEEVSVKAAQLLGAADLDQLRDAFDDLGEVLIAHGVVAAPEGKADIVEDVTPAAGYGGTDPVALGEDDDPVADLVARRVALG